MSEEGRHQSWGTRRAAENEWSSEDVEYKLASIDAGEHLRTDDPTIDAYAAALEAAEPKCEQDRQMIADMSVRSMQLIEQGGSTTTVLEMLRGIEEAVPEDLAPMNCAEVLGTIVTLTVEG